MSITVAPSASFEASFDVGTTGLVGTLSVGIYEGSTDTAHTALATTTINEIGTSGVYVATRTAPSTAGQYLIVWSLDGTLTPAQLATEDLLVTSSPAYAAPSGTAYVSAATLKETLSLTGETFADADLAVAVEAASRAVDNYCARFFYLTSAGVIRYFSAEDSRRIRIDDLVAASQVAIDLSGGTTYATVLTAVTDYTLEPFNASELSKPYTHLDTPRATATYQWPTGYSRAIKITGQWGWPSVPAPIVEATSILAARFVKRAREAPFGIVGLGIDGNAVRISRFDSDIQLMLDPYTRRRLLV